jgi:hypothetical protein
VPLADECREVSSIKLLHTIYLKHKVISKAHSCKLDSYEFLNESSWPDRKILDIQSERIALFLPKGRNISPKLRQPILFLINTER